MELPQTPSPTHFTLVPACTGDIIPEAVDDLPCAAMRSCLRTFSRARAAALRRHRISSSSGGTPPEADDPAFLHCMTKSSCKIQRSGALQSSLFCCISFILLIPARPMPHATLHFSGNWLPSRALSWTCHEKAWKGSQLPQKRRALCGMGTSGSAVVCEQVGREGQASRVEDKLAQSTPLSSMRLVSKRRSAHCFVQCTGICGT